MLEYYAKQAEERESKQKMKSDLLNILSDVGAVTLPEYENALIGHSVDATPRQSMT